MNKEVFISYSGINKETAERILGFLEENEIKCWIAPRDVAPGAVFGGEITRGIKNCTVFLVIYSKEAEGSKHVAKEIRLAVDKDKLIITFKIDDSELNENMDYYLGDCQWINAYPNTEKHFSKLSASISKLISKANVVRSGSSPVTETRKDKKTEVKTIKYKDGKYVGEVLNGKRTGKGVFYFASGNRHEGNWLNGKITGRFKIIEANGKRYWREA